MKLSSWVLLAASAILYALPFIFSSNIWWLIFLFPIPLFYLASREKLGFKQGFIWGLIAFSLHFGGILWNVNALCAQSAGLTRLIPAIIILSYSSICTGIWFSLNAKIIKWLHLISPVAIIAIWASTLWLFVFFFDRLFLWPFDRLEGYFLMHPLLPLAMHPPLLMLMPIIGKNILTLLFCLIPASIALFLVQQNLRTAGFIVLTCIPWCISILIPSAHAAKPAWLDYVVTLSAQFPRMEEPINQALIAQQCFKKIMYENPYAEIIILPESSFAGHQLSTEPQLSAAWSTHYMGKSMQIIMGSFRWDGAHYRNALHWIENGTVKQIFDKRHAMILVERVPSRFNFSILHELFFHSTPEITPSRTPRPCFAILPGVSLTPYICSELFFNEYPDDAHGTPILATTNDSWCINSSTADLMHLAARFKAIQWKREIVYVSYKFASYFDAQGTIFEICGA